MTYFTDCIGYLLYYYKIRKRKIPEKFDDFYDQLMDGKTGISLRFVYEILEILQNRAGMFPVHQNMIDAQRELSDRMGSSLYDDKNYYRKEVSPQGNINWSGDPGMQHRKKNRRFLFVWKYGNMRDIII